VHKPHHHNKVADLGGDQLVLLAYDMMPVIHNVCLQLKRLKLFIALCGISELRNVTCRLGSQCYLPPDTGECTSP